MTRRDGDEIGARAPDVSTFTLLGRAPYQGPRPRKLAPADIERFRRWLAAELRLSTRAAIDVVEWVAFDSRETPHTTMIAVRDGHREFAFSVGKELREVARLDLPRTARPEHLRAVNRSSKEERDPRTVPVRSGVEPTPRQ